MESRHQEIETIPELLDCFRYFGGVSLYVCVYMFVVKRMLKSLRYLGSIPPEDEIPFPQWDSSVTNVCIEI